MRSTGGESAWPSRAATASWGLVLLAAGLETIWALALTKADGMARPGWLLAGFAIAIASLILLTLALRNLRLSSAYTAWVGIGVVGVALTGALVLAEPLPPLRIACLALIVAGVIGLAVSDTPAAPPRAGLEVDDHESRSTGER